ncbi:MAG: carbohydrate-binding domain-containing protein [Eubacterium sp.]|nr:carbohydrate-binding domain-containing protein [Eubacterium sp.]
MSKRVAIAMSLILAAGTIPVQGKEAVASTKGYSISKTGGSYEGSVQTVVTAKKGYKVFFTRNGKYTLVKKIKTGESKIFTVKKNTDLQLIAVKKSKTVTKKMLNGNFGEARETTYTYKIQKDTSENNNSEETDTNENGSQTAQPGASSIPLVTAPTTVPTVSPTSSATPKVSGSPAASAAPTASVTPTASGAPSGNGEFGGGGYGGGSSGGYGGGSSGGWGSTSDTVTGLSAIAADTTKPAALTYNESSATSITMKQASNYSSKESGEGYTIENDSTVGTLLSIKSAGTYIVSTDGSVTGQIKVKKGLTEGVTLVLNGVNLTNSVDAEVTVGTEEYDGAAIVSGKQTKLNIIVASGSTNTLTTTGGGVVDADDPTDTDYPSTILAKRAGSLTIGGTGTLNINSAKGSGIKTKYIYEDTDMDTSSASDSTFWTTTLTIQDSPTINISCYEDDASHSSTRDYDGHQDGISSKNSLAIYGGTLNISAGDDGIHAEATSHIVGGNITVSRSAEGLEGARVVIDGGTLSLTSSDDGINAANGDITTSTTGEDVNIFNITINAGSITVNAEGDGIDSNGNTFITGGTVVVNGPTSGGNGALDVADRTGCLLVTGGSLTATAGTSDMAISPSTQGLGFVAASLSSTVSVGTTLTVKDSSGTTVGTVDVAKSTAWVLISSNKITNGSSYTITNGSTTLATATAGQGSAGGMGGGPGGGMAPGGGGTPPVR